MTLENHIVLVTGATGFLGGTLALRLAAEGVKIRALARSPARGDFLQGLDNIEVVPGDITDAEQMLAVTQGCSHVFHVAAATSGGLEYQRKTNVEGTRNVLEAAAAAQVERVVHISSVAVYGYRHTTDVTEDMGPTPGPDAYSISKSEGEKVARRVAMAHDLSYTVIRPGAIYGPRSRGWTAGMFKRARRKPVVFIGDGSGAMPAIYVDDVVELCIVAATHPAADGQAFNATPDPAPTMRQFIGAYSRLAGHQSWLGLPVLPVKLVARVISALARSNSILKQLPVMLGFLDRDINFKNAKARELLGWQPEVDLETGVQKCVPWLREQGLLD